MSFHKSIEPTEDFRFWQIVLQKSVIGEGLVGVRQDVEAILEPRAEGDGRL
jgi:hypothetical protein